MIVCLQKKNQKVIMPTKFTKKLDLKGFTLVVTSASVGNVGQLACDLMIENLELEKHGMVGIKFYSETC